MSPRTALFWLIVVALVAGLGDQADLLGRLGLGGQAPAAGAGSTATVVRVVDGDTIRVRLSGREETVRYIGVDTPETKKPNTPVQCFGKAASAENERLVAGERVRLVADAEARDRYDRLLAYVYRVSDGAFVNEALLRGGFAKPLTFAPNDRFAARFAAVTGNARRSRAGLWGACGG